MIPPLHVVTDDAVLERGDFLDTAAAICARAGDRLALHLRGPGTSGRTLHRLAWHLRARSGQALLLINDRVDVALTADVDGVHLGQRSLSVPQTRSLLGERGLVGASVHSPEEADERRVAAADFLVVGSVFDTPSHPDREGRGPELVRSVARVARAPLVAIGGISPGRVAVLVDAGASGVAVLSGVWRVGDAVGAVGRLLHALDAALPKTPDVARASRA